jgi:hypothetical protein
MNLRDGRPELARWFAVFDALPVATMTNVAIIFMVTYMRMLARKRYQPGSTMAYG